MLTVSFLQAGDFFWVSVPVHDWTTLDPYGRDPETLPALFNAHVDQQQVYANSAEAFGVLHPEDAANHAPLPAEGGAVEELISQPFVYDAYMGSASHLLENRGAARRRQLTSMTVPHREQPHGRWTFDAEADGFGGVLTSLFKHDGQRTTFCTHKVNDVDDPNHGAIGACRDETYENFWRPVWQMWHTSHDAIKSRTANVAC